jgi:hypothetical protein
MSTVASAARPDSAAPKPPRLIPLTRWSTYHEWPTLGGLRWLVANEHTNGFDRVVRRAGRRVLIDEEAFFEWVRAQNPDASDGDDEEEI